MPAKELVTIATFNEPMVAHLAMGKLEAYGIAGYLGNEHIVGTQWAYANMVGGVQLQVEKSDAQRAIAILNDKTESDSEKEMEMQ
jgi:hypothetical protein